MRRSSSSTCPASPRSAKRSAWTRCCGMLKDFHTLVDREVDGARRRHHQLSRRRRHDPVRPAGEHRRTTPEMPRCAASISATTPRRWIESLPPSIASRTGFKVGAHFGPIVASRLGGGSYQHITATGDSVNVASRLMEVAAKQGVALALSDDLLRRAGPECALLRIRRSCRPQGDADQRDARARFRSGSGATTPAARMNRA